MRRLPSAFLLALLLVLSGSPDSPGFSGERLLQPASVGDETNWIESPFYPLGADHEVMSCLVHNGDLVISGDFAGVSDVLAPGVARWDGNTWMSYPGTERGGVLTVFDGKLTVVQAWPAPGLPIYTFFQVLSWNGSGWDASPIINQLTGTYFESVLHRRVSSVAVMDGKLLVTPIAFEAANYFSLGAGTSATIAQWDGSAWSALTVPGSPGSYIALEVWNGELYASGIEAAPTYDRIIDRWDGTAWTRLLSSAIHYTIFDFAEHDGELYAARENGGVLKWDGVWWSSYANTITAYKLASTPSGLAVATGQDVQRWDGSLWNVLGDLEGPVNELQQHAGDLVAVGDLNGNLSILDGAVWDVPGKKDGQGLSGSVEALLPFQGRLFAAGNLYLQGWRTWTNTGWNGHASVAAWDGANWEKLRSTTSSSGGRRGLAMTLYGENLVVGEGGNAGLFQIAEWDGATWSALGSTYGSVLALAAYDGNLIAGGTFSDLSGVPAGRLASWNGAQWSELDGGVTAGTSVDAITIWDGLLIVAGDFTEVDGNPISYIASWNGHQWRDLEPPGNNPPVVTGPVIALAVHEGNLVASGQFGGAAAVASWDGHDWSPLGGGMNIRPQALHSHGGYLLASGENLSAAGGVPVNRIAAWNGTAWDAMGSGLNNPRPKDESLGWAFADYQGLLYVGGNFRSAGGKPSNHLAMWAAPTALTVLPDTPGKPTLSVQQGLPNPFRSNTRIPLQMPRAGHVVAEVFDTMGRSLGIILDRDLPAGSNTIPWSPRTMKTRSGAAIPAGTYFVRVSALGASRSQKVIYIP